MTVAAQYARNSYTVTFLDWDGTELGSETVLHGESAAQIPSPERTGCTFIGWDASLTNITSDVTTTAQYEINRYLVVFVGTEARFHVSSLPTDRQRNFPKNPCVSTTTLSAGVRIPPALPKKPSLLRSTALQSPRATLMRTEVSQSPMLS